MYFAEVLIHTPGLKITAFLTDGKSISIIFNTCMTESTYSIFSRWVKKSRKSCILMVFIMHTSGNKRTFQKQITKKPTVQKRCSQAHIPKLFFLLPQQFVYNRSVLILKLISLLIVHIVIPLIQHQFRASGLLFDFSDMYALGLFNYTAVVLSSLVA